MNGSVLEGSCYLNAVATVLNLCQEQEAINPIVSPLRVGTETLMNGSVLEGSCYLSAVATAPGSVLASCATCGCTSNLNPPKNIFQAFIQKKPGQIVRKFSLCFARNHLENLLKVIMRPKGCKDGF